jgi:lipopolysaccharide biosynthesis protein
MSATRLKPIAIHLPQFHPIPENDAWWGKGFTEWTNVAKARPLFKGHYQPHLPADLGFYDLRLHEAREAQANLAREYGIYGFCYYHYWFNGRRILERPVQEIFESKKPDFPFMLCWANENWTRVWDGSNKHILLEQKYNTEDDLNHIRALIPYFQDPRYIKIDGKPVFAIYRSVLFPNMEKTIEIWRKEAKKSGFELYLCRFETFGTSGPQYLEPGFDAAIEFQPHINFQPQKLSDKFSVKTLARSIQFRAKKILTGTGTNKDDNVIIPYDEFVEYALKRYKKIGDYKLYRGVCPGWDNTPRRKKAYTILTNSTPELFEHWVRESTKTFSPYSKDENLFFVNAWNEWAEGNHLEPCQRWGRSYLEAFKRALA